jgi:D-alanyl-lipoteichoic acid acyltransferase DltB (MBOAT superfamily)
MLFNSPQFIFVFLPLALSATWIGLRLFGRTGGVAVLIAASLAFYASWHVWAVAVLLLSTAANLAIAHILLQSQRKVVRQALLALGIAANLAVLGYFKYTNFLIRNFDHLFGSNVPMTSIILPIGISFYTFQKIGFLVDVYERKISEVRPLEFMLMVSFFPQLIAGPIVHYREIVPQLMRSLRVEARSVALGLSVFAVGLAKKAVLADALAVYATPRFVDAARGPIDFYAGWIGALAYAFQIYFDFSGYCDMAIGLALMFGIVLPVNFNSPYKSASIIDFWRTWHITLSRFLRDYLYIPLGGNRRGPVRRYANLLVVMLVGGLWHGAAWTFVLWGAIHGAYLVVNHLWRAAGLRLPRALGWPMTFLAVTVAWVPFRSENMLSALRMWRGMAGLDGFQLPYLIAKLLHATRPELTYASTVPVVDFGAGCGVIALAAAVAFLAPNTMQIFGLIDAAADRLRTLLLRLLSSPAYAGVVLFFGLQGVGGAIPSKFIYFQF